MKNQIASILLSLAVIVPGLAFANTPTKAKTAPAHIWHLTLNGLTTETAPKAESALALKTGVKSAKCEVAAKTCTVQGGSAGELKKAISSVSGLSIVSKAKTTKKTNI